MSDKKQNWFVRHKVLTTILGVFLLIVIISAATSSGNDTNTATDSQAQDAPQASQPTESKPEQQPAQRQVQGTAATLGSGTFTGGKDVAVGLYDVTAGAGQSGNFIVNEGMAYNEVLGTDFGVDKVRVKVSDGDNIKISGLTSVTFTPVQATFVTEHKAIDLYAGTFIVGQDVGAGRYVVTPGPGQSGNFIVNDGVSYNEVLGSDLGVPNVTAELKNGDTIKISGLSKLTFTPAN